MPFVLVRKGLPNAKSNGGGGQRRMRRVLPPDNDSVFVSNKINFPDICTNVADILELWSSLAVYCQYTQGIGEIPTAALTRVSVYVYILIEKCREPIFLLSIR